MKVRLLAGIMSVMLSSACGGADEPSAADPISSEPVQTAAESAGFRSPLDVGGVGFETVEAVGVGISLEAATLRALDTAISQVNGRRVSSATAAASAGVSIEIPGGHGFAADSKAYAELICSSSDGVVRSFSVVSSEQVGGDPVEALPKPPEQRGRWIEDPGGSAGAARLPGARYWRVRVRAEVAKFEAPEDEGIPRIVVARPRLKEKEFVIGDERMRSRDVASQMRVRIGDALNQTGRFALLDRELKPELEEEIEFLQSDRARTSDLARIGEQLAADLILVPTLERFDYRRKVRALRSSDRELVSYAGGGVVGVRLVHATTGRVLVAKSFEHDLPVAPPTTMPRRVDGDSLALDLMEGLSDQIVAAVIRATFPVSVVAIEGDTVVMSQGGDNVKEGETYEVVRLGKALTDPQTGRSLGRMDVPCCRVRVTRVSDQTSYGTLVGADPEIVAEFEPGMLELRDKIEEELAVEASVARATETKAGKAGPRGATAARPSAPSTSRPQRADRPMREQPPANIAPDPDADADW